MRARIEVGVLVAALAVGSCGPQGDGPAEPAVDEGDGPAAVRELECFDADYPIEPTFDTPAEALAHAVRTETQDVVVPDGIEGYERVERADGAIDFEFRDGDEVHHTWGIIRDADGRWGVVSLGGCVPARS